MILSRSNFDNQPPPERRTRIQNNPTLLYSWWCTIFSLVIIIIRLWGRWIRNEQLFREDKAMAWSIIPLLARMGFIHVVLIYGTNNVDIEGLTDQVIIHNREIGSRLVLAARIFYALFIWMAKFTVSEFLKRMTERFWKKGYELGLRCIRGFLVVTFIGVVIATLAECQPFTHYWQVVPDPGPQCRQGYAHLLTMGITDIITDVLLVCFPIPIILRSNMSIRRKISLVALFSMSIILIAITATRVPLVIEHRGLQQFRTVLASSEILAATIVSNAIVLGSFLRDRGVKKAKYKGGSTNDSMDRRSSTRRPTLQSCGSDEELARSLGFKTNPELSGERKALPRPAPVADLRLLSATGQTKPFAEGQWQFPSSPSQVSEDLNPKSREIEDPHPSPRAGRRVSFFDVGGLLEAQAHHSVVPSPTDSVLTQDFASQPRRGSRASNTLVPNGRVYPSASRRGSRLSQQSEDYEMTSVRPHHQLQDPGGLLSENDEIAMERESTTSPSAPSNSQSTMTSSYTTPATRSPNRTSLTSLPSLQDAGGLLDTTFPQRSR